MDVSEFVGIMKRVGATEKRPAFRLGTIPNDYAAGRPKVIFDGETEPSVRTYPYLDSYTPAADDRVLVAMVGHSGAVLGKVI